MLTLGTGSIDIRDTRPPTICRRLHALAIRPTIDARSDQRLCLIPLIESHHRGDEYPLQLAAEMGYELDKLAESNRNGGYRDVNKQIERLSRVQARG